jgi:hypothetical protein
MERGADHHLPLQLGKSGQPGKRVPRSHPLLDELIDRR